MRGLERLGGGTFAQASECQMNSQHRRFYPFSLKQLRVTGVQIAATAGRKPLECRLTHQWVGETVNLIPTTAFLEQDFGTNQALKVIQKRILLEPGEFEQ